MRYRVAALFALWLAVCAGAAGAEAPLMAALEKSGVPAEAAAVFEGYAGGLSQAVAADIRGLLDASAEAGAGKRLAGQTSEGVYIDPRGFSLTLPEGWTLLETQVGPAVFLKGPEAYGGVTPTISVGVQAAQEDPFASVTADEVQAYLGEALAGFHLIMLEDFTLRDGPARELVILQSGGQGAELMQYQTHFFRGEMAYTITMTTLAEEAAHGSVLEIYDAFVADFAIIEGEGNG